jgi:hypothetical protein
LLNESGKKRLLQALRIYKEIQEPMWISEDTADATERNPVAKTFNTGGDFDTYVNQHRGIELTSIEQRPLIGESLTEDESMDSQPDTVQSDDKIVITKSIIFHTETEGADILADLLTKMGLADQKPTQQDNYSARYELTDDMGVNQTTVIKKLQDGDGFCWTAFSKFQNSAPDEVSAEPQAD